MSRRNHWIFAFLSISGPSGAAHASPGAAAVAYLNLGDLRQSKFAGHCTTAAGVVAAACQIQAANNWGAANQPSRDDLAASSYRLYFETYYRPPVGHNTQFAGNTNHIAGIEPVFVFDTPIPHGF